MTCLHSSKGMMKPGLRFLLVLVALLGLAWSPVTATAQPMAHSACMSDCQHSTDGCGGASCAACLPTAGCTAGSCAMAVAPGSWDDAHVLHAPMVGLEMQPSVLHSRSVAPELHPPSSLYQPA